MCSPFYKNKASIGEMSYKPLSARWCCYYDVNEEQEGHTLVLSEDEDMSFKRVEHGFTIG